MKKIKFLSKVGVSFLLLTFLFTLRPSTVGSKMKSYYTGDATNYHNQVILGTTNMGGFELFKLVDNKIIRTTKIRSFDAQYSGYEDFHELVFNIENDILYIYLVDGKYIYKYDISNLYTPKFINKVKDNSWDWFRGVDKANGKIITIGTKGVKIWNTDLQVIDSFDVVNEYARNISFDNRLNNIFNIEDNIFNVFGTNSRKIVSSFTINSKENHNRKFFISSNNSRLYLVDDNYFRELGYNGEITKSFKHTSTLGYDVAGISGSEYLYFSDGIGIVKIRLSDLKPLTWVYTTDLAGGNGWAMGLEVVGGAGEEKIINFNNSAILVFDKNLKLLDSFKAYEEREDPIEKLFLNTNIKIAAPGANVVLSGGGFGLNEDLKINFAGKKYDAKTDDNGRFMKVLEVPAILPNMVDIKVDGQQSNLTYSISFKIN